MLSKSLYKTYAIASYQSRGNSPPGIKVPTRAERIGKTAHRKNNSVRQRARAPRSTSPAPAGRHALPGGAARLPRDGSTRQGAPGQGLGQRSAATLHLLNVRRHHHGTDRLDFLRPLPLTPR